MHVTLITVVSLALLAGPPPGKGPRDKEKKADLDDEKGRFTREQRGAFGAWSKGRGCPPGLAKKNNGCLPPGLARKRWEMGKPLPRDVRWEAPPRDILDRLGPAPRGYQYAMVDGDLLKLAAGTLLVVDAIEALLD